MHFKYFDGHTHIHFPSYNKDRDELVVRAIDQGVGMVTVGTTQKTSEEAIKIAEAFMNIWATVGIHPAHASESFHDPDEMGTAAHDGMKHPVEIFNEGIFKKFVENPRVVAIGECGLDFHRLEGDAEKTKQAQKKLFLDQIYFAHRAKKPLMIHCREAFPELIEILENNREMLDLKNAGVIHFFGGTKEEAERLLSLGFSFTFGGVITFPQKSDQPVPYRDLIRSLPFDRILSETDAPYVAPVPFRGKRNQPAYVTYVTKRLAEFKNVTEEEMATQILLNAERIFKISLK